MKRYKNGAKKHPVSAIAVVDGGRRRLRRPAPPPPPPLLPHRCCRSWFIMGEER